MCVKRPPGTGACYRVKVSRTLSIARLTLTSCGAATVEVGNWECKAHDTASLSDDVVESPGPSVRALDCVNTNQKQSQECDLLPVGVGINQGSGKSCYATK